MGADHVERHSTEQARFPQLWWRRSLSCLRSSLGDEVGANPLGRSRDNVSDPAWQPCGDDSPGYDCATFTVPLDYDRPARRTTQLALARFPAADTDRRIGTVFVNPGGPGGSGVGMVLGGFGEFLGSQLDGRFDIVGFDPRGVAASDPLHCFDSGDDLDAFLADLPFFPYRHGQYRPSSAPTPGWDPSVLTTAAGRRPHEHRGRRPGHGPASTGGR